MAIVTGRRGELMVRKVIALWGVANVGKSDTVKKAYELLISKYANALTGHQILAAGADIKAILTIRGVKVGIESQGDPGGRLEKSLSLFVQAQCRVIICATRTRGQTVKAVEQLEPSYQVIWLEQALKSTAPEQQSSNLAMARKLVEEAEEAINA